MRRIKTVFRDRNKTPSSPLPLEDQSGGQATANSPDLQKTQPKSSSEESGDTSVFPDGIKVWHECPDAVVDICFVHGLTGNRDTTWTAHGQSTPWPKTLLPSQLSKTRLLTYGYDAYVVRASVASTNRLLDHATNLLIDLTNDRRREDASTRPLIFVAHSLGGLVCKEAILLSRNHPEPHLHAIFDHVLAVAFMGTPHKGSWMADWAKLPASALGLMKSTNRKLLAILETDSQFLESIQAGFLSMVRDVRERGRRLDVTCFFEELPLNVAGCVVSKESATLDGYTAISIHANHRNMVRFLSSEDTGFHRVLGELRRWTAPLISAAENSSNTNAGLPGAIITHAKVDLSPKVCNYIPFPKNKRFVGRESTLKRLQDMLFSQDCQKAALVGLGGIGKTQVALQLAYWVKEHRPEHSIFWVPTLSLATFEEAYVEIARRLEIQKQNNGDDLKDLVRDHLSSDAAGPWLLIVDNADDGDVLFSPGGIINYLPESESGLILFTTRSREVAVGTVGSEVVDLSAMEWAEATSFLEKSLIRKDLINSLAVKELLEEMTYLPLAITQAAAYLNKNQISIAEYLRLLRSAEENMVGLLSKEFRDSTRYSGSNNSVAATWLVSFEQIIKSDSFADELLSFISRIEPKAILQSILPKADTEEHTTSAIGLLCGYAFLNRRGDTDVFDMHSLVHVAINIWLEKNQRTEEAQAYSIKHLAAIFPPDHRASNTIWRSLLPHTTRALSRIQICETMDTSWLYYCIGCCLYRDRRSKEAIRYLKEACRWMEEMFDEDDQDYLRMVHTLASAHVENGDDKEAINILERVVAILEQTSPEGDRDRLASQFELARAYAGDGQLGKATELLEYVVAMEKENLPEDSVLRLVSEHELARVYIANKQTKDAIRMLKHITAIETATLPEEAYSRLTSVRLLGEAYIKDGQPENGIPLLEHVVNVREKTLPSDDQVLLVTQESLAQAYKNAGLTRKAVELLERVVAIRDETLSEGHTGLSSSHENLAFLYVDCGEIGKAVNLFEQQMPIDAKTMQDVDVHQLGPMAFLGYLYQRNGQPEKAIELLELLAPLQEKAFPYDHTARLVSQHNLACSYEDIGQLSKAKALLETVVAIEAKTLSDGDPRLTVSHKALARISQKANDSTVLAEEHT